MATLQTTKMYESLKKGLSPVLLDFAVPVLVQNPHSEDRVNAKIVSDSLA